MAPVPPTSKFTNHFIKNTKPNANGVVIERTYGGLIIPANGTRRIRTADISILQTDAQLEADIMAAEIVITYPVRYLKGTMRGAYPEGFISSDAYTSAALDIIKTLGQRQGYQSISFQRVGLISLPQSGSNMLSTDPGGVWLKHGSVPCDISPPAVTSSPVLLRMSASWNGTVSVADSLFLDVLMRRDSSFPWETISGGQTNGSNPTSFTVNLADSNYGNTPEIAVRIKAGIVTDLTVDIMITGK